MPEAITLSLAEALDRDGMPGRAKVEYVTRVEQRVVEIPAEMNPGRAIHANAEFHAGIVMNLCELPHETSTPAFASSRVIGWCAHVSDQAAEGRIIRPSARQFGEPSPAPVPSISSH